MHEASAIREPRRSVVAVTSEDDRFVAARHAGVDEARTRRVPLILYDWDAASWLGEPLPNWWSSEGAAEEIPDRLNDRRLENAGRGGIAAQVREARRRGVETYGWLPKDHGPGALADYAAEQGAEVIVLPEELAKLDGVDALINGTARPASELSASTSAKLLIAVPERPVVAASLRSIGFDPDDWA